MKKRSLTILMAALLCAVSLSGCGSNEPVIIVESSASAAESAAPSETPSPAPVEERKPEETEAPEETKGIDLLSAIQISDEWDYSDYERDNYNCVTAVYTSFLLNDDSAAKYPALAKTLEEMFSENMKNVKASADEMKTWYDESADDYYYGALEETSAEDITRADDVVFAWRENYYSYGGGAHGYYAIGGTAIDTQTGKKLSLGDVITDEKKFKDITAKFLDDTYDDIFFGDIYTVIDEYDMSEFTWFMDYYGITVCFNPYEVASYADGELEVYFSYDEYPELIAEKYRQVPDKYVIKMTEYYEYNEDINNDGAKERFSYTNEYTGDEMFDYLPVYYINGKRIESSMKDYDSDVFFVKNGDASYIYTFHYVENDYSILEILDMNTRQFIGEYYGNAGGYALPGDYEFYDMEEWTNFVKVIPVFNNPDDFALDSRMEILSTYDGTKNYHIGANGLPVSEDEFYEVNVNWLLKSIDDIPCQLVDMDGKVLNKNATLPANTFVKIMRAGDKFADVIAVGNYVADEEEAWYFPIGDQDLNYNTDAVYRIIPDADSNFTINDIGLYSLFEGLMYAG